MEKLTIQERNEAAVELQRMWQLLFKEVPQLSQFYRWLDLHHICFIGSAILRTSEKAERMEEQSKVMTLDHAVRFCSSVANAIKSDAENKYDLVYAKKEEENNMTNENPNEEVQTHKYLGGLIVPREVAEEKIAIDPKTQALTPQMEEK